MNKRYLDLMEKTLSAYSDEHIIRFFNDVKVNGFNDQGFARMASNIGILIAYGRRRDLTELFLEMMELCCKTIPTKKAANDFSVREIISCIWELEKNNAVSAEHIARWKGYMATIEVETCYTRFAKTPTDAVRNWALFTGVSEFFRLKAGLCKAPEETLAFVELQIEQQLQWFDENGMYMDNTESEIYQPIVYDLVPRGLFCALLHAGYRGKYYTKIDEILKKAGLLTLKMQSVTGEAAFGGRSNQFVHNEAWIAGIFEYEALRYQKAGDCALAGTFKAASDMALCSAEQWLAKKPITHVKNRFPIASKFACETYAYFDKYMITAASCFYVASVFCDDTINAAEFDESAMIWSTSKYFHKTFARAGGYSLEFDVNGDPHYDASGLGRVHKKGAPGSICLSVPFAKTQHYYGGKLVGGTEISMIKVGNPVNDMPFSICPVIKAANGEWLYGADEQTQYTLLESKSGMDKAELLFACAFANGAKTAFGCSVEENGVLLTVRAQENEEIALALPVFYFDGEKHTTIIERNGKLCVEYEGWICEYETQSVQDINTEFANRNGIYKGYLATGKGQISVRIKIYPLK